MAEIYQRVQDGFGMTVELTLSAMVRGNVVRVM